MSLPSSPTSFPYPIDVQEGSGVAGKIIRFLSARYPPLGAVAKDRL
jgi:hypothetical protein